jgi:predicted DNA-binding protein
MTLTIELPPELQRRLEEEAARVGQRTEEFVRSVLEDRLTSVPSAAEARLERNRRAIALLQQWSEEDALDPDPDPLPTIPPLSLREVKFD